jgi:Ni,Fe-hydrogenase III small subunit
MLNLISKIIKTPRLIESVDMGLPPEYHTAGAELSAKVKKIFNGSLAIRVVTAGGTNAEEQELVALGNPYYDVERFGIHFVASPRHADMLMVTGPVSRNMYDGLMHSYEATPTPKIVVAVGDDAINGGIFKGSYAVLDGARGAIPVDYEIPGDPPSPMTIMTALLQILGDLEGSTFKVPKVEPSKSK